MIFRAIFLLSTLTAFALPPKDALERLMDGNKRYISDEPHDRFGLSSRREETLHKQTPFAVIVGCSDSRVPPEIIFDEGVGDLFIVRVAGNVVGSVELDSIRYAVKILNSNLILVLGHESCGAINAVLEGNTADIQAIADLIPPFVKETHGVEAAVKENVRWVVNYLKKSARFKKLVDEGKIAIQGAYYHFRSGEVELLSELK